MRTVRNTRAFAWAALAVALLLTGCSSTTSERIDEIYALRLDPTPANVEALRGFLDDPEADLRVTALNCLVSLRVADAAALAVAGLEDESPFVRATAAKLVGDLEEPALAPYLVRRVRSDPDPLVRRRAAQALANTDGEGAGDALVSALRDPDPQVRLEAIKGAKKLAPGRGAAALIELLAEDPMWEIRVQAAGALALCGEPEAGAALEAALEDPVEFVRGAAAKALKEFVPAPPAAPEPEEEVAD